MMSHNFFKFLMAKLEAKQYLTDSLQTDSARSMEHNHCFILSLRCPLPIIIICPNSNLASDKYSRNMKPQNLLLWQNYSFFKSPSQLVFDRLFRYQVRTQAIVKLELSRAHTQHVAYETLCMTKLMHVCSTVSCVFSSTQSFKISASPYLTHCMHGQKAHGEL